MKAISFAWTTPAFLAGRKTVTRRQWQDNYARRFRPGEIVAAYDRQPLYGGKKIGTIRIVSVTKEANRDIPADDWEGEGFAYLTDIGMKVNGMTPREMWDDWKASDGSSYVVRFEAVPA